MEESVLSGPRLLGDKPNASGKAQHLLMHFCFPLSFFLKKEFLNNFFLILFSLSPSYLSFSQLSLVESSVSLPFFYMYHYLSFTFLPFFHV